MNSRRYGILICAIAVISLNCSKRGSLGPSPLPVPPPAGPSAELVEYLTIVKDTAIVGVPFSANVNVTYTYGNGRPYATGGPVSSATVHGLKATVQPGTLALGNGSLPVKISGTATEPWSVDLFFDSLINKSIRIQVEVLTQDLYDYINASPMGRIVLRANKLLSMLAPAELAAVQQPYTKANAVKWWVDPLPCNGCHIGLHVENGTKSPNELSYEKKGAFYSLMQAVLNIVAVDNQYSYRGNGHSEFSAITSNSVGFLNNPGTPPNNAIFGDYYLTIFGTPSSGGNWALQFSGHNFAINYAFSNGQLIGATPSFRGMEPPNFQLPSPATVANTVLNDERSAFVALFEGLTPAQRADAKLNTVFNDILLGAGKDDQFPVNRQGLRVGTLGASQQQLVIDAVYNYIADPAHTMADQILARYTNELPDTYISWSGDAALKKFGDYVRIDGPSVWIEFICKPGVAYKDSVCYYTVWRDRKKDYGGQ